MLKLILLPFYAIIYVFKFMMWLVIRIPLAIINALAHI